MKVINLGWAVAKEDNIGVNVLCPSDSGDGYATPAQSIYISKPVDLSGARTFCARPLR